MPYTMHGFCFAGITNGIFAVFREDKGHIFWLCSCPPCGRQNILVVLAEREARLRNSTINWVGAGMVSSWLKNVRRFFLAEEAGRLASAESRSRPVRYFFSWQGKMLWFFLFGIVLETSATVLNYCEVGATAIDEAMSLCAVVFMAGAGWRILARNGFVTLFVPLAVVLFFSAKLLDVSANTGYFGGIWLLERGRLNRAVENGLSVAGILLVVINFILSTLRAQRAKQDLENRHRALLVETEGRRQVQRKLQESEQRLRMILDATSEGVFDYNLITGELYKSPRFIKMMGFKVEEISSDVAFWEARLHPEDVLAVEREVRKHLAGETPYYRSEYRIKTKQGDWKWILSRGKVIEWDDGGRPLRMVGVHADISERKAGEEEYRRLFTAIEQAAESVMITDTEGVIQYVNPAFEKTSGYARGEVLGERPDILERGKVDDLIAAVWADIQRGKVWHGRFVNKHKDGHLYEENVTISPVRNQAGDIINYVALKQDITQQVALEKQLFQSQKMQALGTLAGGIAHDFRNILSLILGYCEIALRDMPEEASARMPLQQIEKAGNRATELVKQILTFSRKTEVEHKPLEIALIIKEALKLLSTSLPATVELRTHVQRDCGLTAADPTQVHQVVMNLYTNAYQALTEQRGILEIALKRCTLAQPLQCVTGTLSAGEYVQLSVRDSGRGIDADTLPHIFDPFFTTKAPGEGTGLGLSVVHGILSACGGGIVVESVVGQGTEMFVYWPSLQVEAPISVEAPQEGVAGKERVLLVDDEEDIVEMAGMLLRRMGYKVTALTSSTQALQLLEQNEDAFDLLLTDNIMPGCTGVGLAQHVQQNCPDLPVILMTGFSENITPEEARRMGIAQFITKPFSTALLGKAIRDALDEVSV